MTIKEIEELAGMPRANIRYYEEQGLLTPTRNANGYREYSEEDLSVLKKIKLLRSLHMSMEKIKALHTSEQELSVVLEQQIKKLSAEKEDADKAQRVCETMYKDGIKYENLDAEKYLKNLNEDSQYIKVRNYGETKESREDIIPRVQAPWRRFFARMLDEAVYATLWYCFLLIVFQINTTNEGSGWKLLEMVMTLLLTIVLEPLQLSLFGTTLGKWILGLRVLDNYDGKLSFSYAFDRTKDVICYGMGFHIPVYYWFRMWKSYVKCTDGEELEWENGSRIILKDEKKYRAVVYVVVEALLIGIMVLANVLVLIPVHQGKLTVSEFCENYRRLAKYYGVTSTHTLDDNGVWKDNTQDEGTVDFYSFSVDAPPAFIFETDEDGNIQDISFVVEVETPEGTPKEEKEMISSQQLQMQLAALAFVGAQDEFSQFSSARQNMVDQIAACEFKDFDFSEAGVRLTCDVEWAGYERAGNGLLYSLEDGACSFYMEFSMSIQN